MSHEAKKQAIKELADKIKSQGYRVFIAHSGTYGIYTDKDGSQLVSFQYDLGGVTFSGNYVTSLPRQTGTGWQLVTHDFAGMLRAMPPPEFVRGATWRKTTLAEYMKVYQASSKFVEVE